MGLPVWSGRAILEFSACEDSAKRDGWLAGVSRQLDGGYFLLQFTRKSMIAFYCIGLNPYSGEVLPVRRSSQSDRRHSTAASDAALSITRALPLAPAVLTLPALDPYTSETTTPILP